MRKFFKTMTTVDRLAPKKVMLPCPAWTFLFSRCPDKCESMKNKQGV
jgi:hypothetical protein